MNPWYENGLKFSCRQCGACCTGAPGYVWLKQSEITSLAERLNVSRDEFSKLYLRKVGGRISLIERENGDCILLENGKCGVYNSRPVQCRTFPFWKENLVSQPRWNALKSGCPGINSGTHYSKEQIDKLKSGGETLA